MKPYLNRLQQDQDAGLISPHIAENMIAFYESYLQVLRDAAIPTEAPEKNLHKLYQIMVEEQQNPYTFDHFHATEHTPHDYYNIGMDIFRPLILLEKSKLLGEENIEKIEEQLKQKHNVIFLANHQSEADPQAIGVLIEKKHPKLAEAITYVAGHRVVSDPLAKPLSRGRNLFCIYSKRYIENPPEEKEAKQHHNQQTMRVMGEMLAAGGMCIYVAPSGGRDRPGPHGKPVVAPFDAQSLEMFALIARKSGAPTHFYPMSLATFDLLPPPDTIQVELGEERRAQRTPVFVAIGNEIDMNTFPGSDATDKKLWRQNRAEYIWNLVVKGYEQLLKD